MDGVTDATTRAAITSIFEGRCGVSVCATEFVRVTGQPVVAKVLLRSCPELRHGGTTPSGVPVFVQLLGSDPAAMATTAHTAVALGAPGIDLNFGCPAKTVNAHDGGATLLKAPERITRVTAAVRSVVPPELPVSVKVRIGWDGPEALAAIADAAQRGGATWLTVHARTRTQLYRPPVHWAELARAREAVSIPVVANGDLVDEASVRACARKSGCSAFMIGRAALGAPDLFARLRGFVGAPLADDDLATLIARWLDGLEAQGRPADAVLRRLKQWLRLAVFSRPTFADRFDRVKRCASLPLARLALAESGVAHEPPRARIRVLCA
jgi:tRNA-dihydrouridine synthase C